MEQTVRDERFDWRMPLVLSFPLHLNKVFRWVDRIRIPRSALIVLASVFVVLEGMKIPQLPCSVCLTDGDGFFVSDMTKGAIILGRWHCRRIW
jgi:hypothetical protein